MNKGLLLCSCSSVTAALTRSPAEMTKGISPTTPPPCPPAAAVQIRNYTEQMYAACLWVSETLTLCTITFFHLILSSVWWLKFKSILIFCSLSDRHCSALCASLRTLKILSCDSDFQQRCTNMTICLKAEEAAWWLISSDDSENVKWEKNVFDPL